MDKLKVRNELNILIDEWADNEEVFLEVRRLKDLFLFYHTEPNDIEKIYYGRTAHLEMEIAAESFYHLGLIEMQKALQLDLAKECLSTLKKSHSFFQQSGEIIENRIDARFFQTVTSLIIDLLEEKFGGVEQKIITLSDLLLQKQVFSISDGQNHFQLGFYRTLLNLNKIKNQNISDWLDFRKGFNDLFYYFSELKNVEIENRLNESVLHQTFGEYLEKSFVQPYFAQNFPAEIAKINARLNEEDIPAEEIEFLHYLKELA